MTMRGNANTAVFVYQIRWDPAAVVSARWGMESRMGERSRQATKDISAAARQGAANDLGIGVEARDDKRFARRERLCRGGDALSRAPNLGRLGFAGAAVLLVVLALIAALLPYT